MYLSGSKTIMEYALDVRGWVGAFCRATACGRRQMHLWTRDRGRSAAGSTRSTPHGVKDATRNPVALASWFANAHAPVNSGDRHRRTVQHLGHGRGRHGRAGRD